MRVIPGPNPSETALTEIYELPAVTDPKADVLGFSPRGADVDRNGVMWSALSSGHLASFDRRKCKGPLNGPKATGQHCREGWTFYPEPLPQFKGVTDPAAPRGVTTRGSTSSTRLASVRTHRSIRAMRRKACLR